MTALPPLIVVGAPRSGTSLLYTVLCLHPEAAWTSNWLHRLPWAPPVTVLNRITAHVPGRRRSAWFGPEASNAYVYSNRRSILDRAFPRPAEAETLFRRCGISEDPRASANQDAIIRLRKSFEAVRKWSGGKLMVNKRIANNQRIPLLLEAFPRARFVSLVRDGRAVALSLSRVTWWNDHHIWWYGNTPTAWKAAGGDPWELCARHWVEEVRQIDISLAEVPPEQVIRVSYESLVDDPLPKLTEILRFAGLSPDPPWLSALAKVRFPNMNERWRHDLTPETVELIEQVQIEELARYGYT